MITNANHPKALTGMRDENPFDMKAKAVVEEVAEKTEEVAEVVAEKVEEAVEVVAEKAEAPAENAKAEKAEEAPSEDEPKK